MKNVVLQLVLALFLERCVGRVQETSVTSEGVLCTVTGERVVSCFHRNKDGAVAPFLTTNTGFDIVKPFHLQIYKNTLFVSSGLNLVIQSLEVGGVKRTFSLPHPIHTMLESGFGVQLLYLHDNGSRIQWMLYNEQAKVWELSPNPQGFLGDDTISSDTTSNVVLFHSTWGDTVIVYGIRKSSGSQLKFIQLPSGSVYTTDDAPSSCATFTSIIHVPHNSLLLLLCRNQLFAYQYNDAVWVDRRDVSSLKISNLYVHPKGQFIAALLHPPSTRRPSQIVFMNFEWQKSFISLRKSSLEEGLFMEDGNHFCFMEKKLMGLTCYNVSMLLSNNEFTVPTMQTYSLPSAESTIIGSIGKQVVIRYTSPEKEKTAYAALPKEKHLIKDTIEIDRVALCSETKRVLPTLSKIFCP
jgi:hypothetical protein